MSLNGIGTHHRHADCKWKAPPFKLADAAQSQRQVGPRQFDHLRLRRLAPDSDAIGSSGGIDGSGGIDNSGGIGSGDGIDSGALDSIGGIGDSGGIDSAGGIGSGDDIGIGGSDSGGIDSGDGIDSGRKYTVAEALEHLAKAQQVVHTYTYTYACVRALTHVLCNDALKSRCFLNYVN